MEPKRFQKCRIDLESDKDLVECIEMILKYRHETFEHMDKIEWDEMKELGLSTLFTVYNL